MPNVAPGQQEDYEPIQESSVREAVGREVMRSLGRPRDLLAVRVHAVGTGRYRVNVFAGADAASGKIVNSYFLSTDDAGKILNSSPEIVRLY